MENKIAAIFFALVISSQVSFSQTQKVQTMKPFKINIGQHQIDDLKNRLAQTRYIQHESQSAWGPNLSLADLKAFADYWQNKYDWKKQELKINGFDQYLVRVNELNVHFIYQKGTGSQHIPVLLLHGWGAQFPEFLNMAELIKEENPEIDLIIPSIPGFGFSAVPDSVSSGTSAPYLHQLMTQVLGYSHYYVHGGDYGAFLAEKLAIQFPESVKGIHLSDIPYYHLYAQNESLTEAERKFQERINTWSIADGAYGSIQSTKPKPLATGLNDSPMGLAAWLLQLYHDLGNKEIPLFERFSQEELATTISVYWFTETIYSSMRLYSEDGSGFDGQPIAAVKVPTAFNLHQFDISGFPPREFAERFFSNIISWTEVKDGGHFAGLSHSQQLKKDLLSFIQSVEK